MTDKPDTRPTDERRVEETGAPRRGVVRHNYDPNADCDLTTEVVRAVAEKEGVSPTELPAPLYESVDVESLEETLFGGRTANGTRQRSGSVEFDYTGHRVTVTAEGQIEVSEGDAAASR